MPTTEGWTLRAPLNLVTQAAAVTAAKLGEDRAPADRGQLARAGLYALALGYVSEARLAECVKLAELRGGWPTRDEGPARLADRMADLERAAGFDQAADERHSGGRWITRASAGDVWVPDDGA